MGSSQVARASAVSFHVVAKETNVVEVRKKRSRGDSRVRDAEAQLKKEECATACATRNLSCVDPCRRVDLGAQFAAGHNGDI